MQSAATARPRLAVMTRTGRLNSSSASVRMTGSVGVVGGRTTAAAEMLSTVLSLCVLLERHAPCFSPDPKLTSS